MINLDDKIKQLIEQGQRFNEQSQYVKDLEYKIRSLEQNYITLCNHVGTLQDEKIELRQKIDKALKRADHACIGTAMFHKQFNDVINILRGEE